jgi:hypothetical protein
VQAWTTDVVMTFLIDITAELGHSTAEVPEKSERGVLYQLLAESASRC